MSFLRHARLPTIRSKLITLVLVSVVPILFGALVLVVDAGRREEEHVARDAATITRALVAALDRELDSAESAARVAAAWPAPMISTSSVCAVSGRSAAMAATSKRPVEGRPGSDMVALPRVILPPGDVTSGARLSIVVAGSSLLRSGLSRGPRLPPTLGRAPTASDTPG